MVQPLNILSLHSVIGLGLGVSLLSVTTLAIAAPTHAKSFQWERDLDRHDEIQNEIQNEIQSEIRNDTQPVRYPAPRAAQTPQAAQTMMAQTTTMPVRMLERDLLSLGSEGEDVRELQAILALLGHYSGEITGRFDRETAQAARSFQASANLSADAVIGPASWSRLLPAALDGAIVETSVGTSTITDNASSATTRNTNTVPAPDRVNRVNRDSGSTRGSSLPTIQRGSTGDFVFFLQQQLTLMGYYSGGIDGDFGSVTEAAVIEVQLDYGLVPDGIVDASVWPYILN